MEKPTDFKTLEELSLPLHKWLQDNYDPYATIVIGYDSVKIVRDIAFAPLPIRD